MLGNAYETAEDRLGNGQPKICALGCDLGLRASYTMNPNDRERSTFHAERYRPWADGGDITVPCRYPDLPCITILASYDALAPCMVFFLVGSVLIRV